MIQFFFPFNIVRIISYFLCYLFRRLPVKAKTTFKVIIPMCLWAWLMHAADLAFNILPAEHNAGYPLKWSWLPLGCLMFMGGFLARIFVNKFTANPPYPSRDPRLLEAMGVNANVVYDLGKTSPGGVK